MFLEESRRVVFGNNLSFKAYCGVAHGKGEQIGKQEIINRIRILNIHSMKRSFSSASSRRIGPPYPSPELEGGPVAPVQHAAVLHGEEDGGVQGSCLAPP